MTVTKKREINRAHCLNYLLITAVLKCIHTTNLKDKEVILVGNPWLRLCHKKIDMVVKTQQQTENI